MRSAARTHCDLKLSAQRLFVAFSSVLLYKLLSLVVGSNFNPYSVLPAPESTRRINAKLLQWDTIGHLNQHRNPHTHSLYNEWRVHQNPLASSKPDGKFRCPFGCESSCITLRGLIVHIESSRPDDSEYDTLKTSDGRYDLGFNPDNISWGKRRRLANDEDDKKVNLLFGIDVNFTHPLNQTEAARYKVTLVAAAILMAKFLSLMMLSVMY